MSTSNNIFSTPWGKQFYMSMLMRCGGVGGGGYGGGLYFKGRFNRGFAALSVCGAYTWRGMFSEFDSSTLIQYKNVILLLLYLYILYLI